MVKGNREADHYQLSHAHLARRGVSYKVSQTVSSTILFLFSFIVHLFAVLPKVWITPESRYILRAGEREQRDLMITALPHFSFLQLLAEEII